MQIFVINLRRQPERRESVARTLSEHQVNYQFFDAIDGHDNLHTFFSGMNKWMFLLEAGHFATPGEVNCYASHLSLWKECLRLDQPIVILEDDLQATRNFRKVIEYAQDNIMSAGFVRLEAIEKRWENKKHLGPVLCNNRNGLNLYRQTMPSVHTTGYAISPACASAFIEASRVLTAPVDHMIRRCWHHRQALYAIMPPAIESSGHAVTSSIGKRKKHPLRYLYAGIRPAYRFLERRRAIAFAASSMISPGLR